MAKTKWTKDGEGEVGAVRDPGRGLQVAKASKGSKPRQAMMMMMMTMMKSKRKQSCRSRAETGTGAGAGAGAGHGCGQGAAAAPSTAERMTETCFAERMRLWAVGV